MVKKRPHVKLSYPPGLVVFLSAQQSELHLQWLLFEKCHELFWIVLWIFCIFQIIVARVLSKLTMMLPVSVDKPTNECRLQMFDIVELSLCFFFIYVWLIFCFVLFPRWLCPAFQSQFCRREFLFAFGARLNSSTLKTLPFSPQTLTLVSEVRKLFLCVSLGFSLSVCVHIINCFS